jgi:predicted DNA-binding transcriptional regulator AlpA
MPELLSKRDVCRLLGNIHPSTLWRGIKAGRYPRPIHVSTQVRRWDRNEVELVLRRMMETRR